MKLLHSRKVSRRIGAKANRSLQLFGMRRAARERRWEGKNGLDSVSLRAPGTQADSGGGREQECPDPVGPLGPRGSALLGGGPSGPDGGIRMARNRNARQHGTRLDERILYRLPPPEWLRNNLRMTERSDRRFQNLCNSMAPRSRNFEQEWAADLH